MARKKSGSTATKAKPGKKGRKDVEGETIDQLAKEIEDDLSKTFEFDDEEPKGSKSLIDEIVTFESDDGDTITGKVVKQDGDSLTVEDDTAFWTATVEDVEVVGEGSKAKAELEDDLGLDLDDLADDEPAEAKPETKKEKKAREAAEKKAAAAEKKADAAKKKADAADKKEEAAATKKKASAKPPAKEPADSKVRERRMLPIDKIKISKAKPREVDKESDDYKKVKNDIKRRGQRDAIRIQSFSNPLLIEGNNRLAIFKEFNEAHPGKGWDEIECQEDDSVEDADDRLMAGLMDNEMRIKMHWLDLAKSFAKLIKGGKYTQGKISKALGMSPSSVSRMVAALKLPKATLEVARDLETSSGISAGVFQEMASAPKQVIKELTSAISDGRNVTMADVRALKKSADKAEREKARAASGGSEEGESASRAPAREPARAYTYRDLSAADVGDYIRVRVHADHVELRVHIEWDKKTFRNFDPAAELKGLFDAVFAEEELSLDSFKGLQKAMNAAKAELAGGQG